MSLESRLRDHLAAKAERINATPSLSRAQAPPRVSRSWRFAAAVTAAVAVVLVTIGTVAWTVRVQRTAEPPPAADIDELAAPLRDPSLQWTAAGSFEFGELLTAMGVGRDVVVIAAGPGPDGAPLRVWSGGVDRPLTEVPVSAAGFRAGDAVMAVAWDGTQYHAFGAGPAESLVWTSTNGVDWDREALPVPAGPGDSPYVTAVVTDVVSAAGSRRGVVAGLVLTESFDWEAFLADRLGTAYQPGSAVTRTFDGATYRFRDESDELVASVSAEDAGYDERAPRDTTVVLAAPGGGGEYAPLAGLPAGTPPAAVTVQASNESMLVVADAHGSAPAAAWVSADGRAWQPAAAAFGAHPLEPGLGAGWRDLLLAAYGDATGYTVLASRDGLSWEPATPPLVTPAGLPGPLQGVATGDGGIFAYGSGASPVAPTDVAEEPSGWFSADGEAWSAEDVLGGLGGPGLVADAAVTTDAVAVLFARTAGGEDQAPPAGSLELWVGRVAG